MNKDEYVIVNKTTLEKRIEELEVWSKRNERVGEYDSEGLIISELRHIISQSVPLIPEIEKAFEQGQNSVEAVMKCEEFGDMDWYAAKKITQTKQDYISNLKLDI